MIRKMSEQDIPSVMEIERLCFSDSPWPREEFLYELKENPFSVLCVSEKENRIAGFIDWWILYEKAQVANIAVHPEFRKQGIAREMLKNCIRDAEKKGCETLSLEVRTGNEPAIVLYHSFGFIDAAIRRNYYENGEDAILMVLPLGGES